MRPTGTLHDPGDSRTHDHLAWAGESFAHFAAAYFAGAAADEQLVLVGDDLENVSAAIEGRDELVTSGKLVLLDPAGAYLTLATDAFDVDEQLERWQGVLDAARAAGFRALRVAADNTAALTGDDRTVERWLAWEQVADRWQAYSAVTGGCFFDTTRVDPERLHRVATVHPVSGGALDPRLRMFTDPVDGVLRVQGSVESDDAGDLRAYVERAGIPAVLDVSDAEYVHHRALLELAHGPRVELRNAPPIVRRMWELLELEGGTLTVR